MRYFAIKIFILFVYIDGDLIMSAKEPKVKPTINQLAFSKFVDRLICNNFWPNFFIESVQTLLQLQLLPVVLSTKQIGTPHNLHGTIHECCQYRF